MGDRASVVRGFQEKLTGDQWGPEHSLREQQIVWVRVQLWAAPINQMATILVSDLNNVLILLLTILLIWQP